MDKLIDYICDELHELEKKASKGGLSMSEIQYLDTLAHAKKNLLTSEAMEEYDGDERSEYSGDNMSSRRNTSYGRGKYARRDSKGRYMSYGNPDGYNYGSPDSQNGMNGMNNMNGNNASYAMRNGNSYGYSQGTEEMRNRIQMMMNQSTDNKEREVLQKLMNTL